LFKAKVLAFSRFNFLPVNNSASNSAAIDDSKSNKEPPIFSTWVNVKPNRLAFKTVLANSSVPPLKFNLVNLLVLAICLKIVALSANNPV